MPKFPVLLYAVLMYALVACSEDPTSVPPTATKPPTPPATATASPIPPTRTPTPTSAPTATATPLSDAAKLPTLVNATEVKVNTEFAAATLATFTGSIPGARLTLYASDQDPDTFAADTNNAFVQAGWQFAVPGLTKPGNQGNSIVGLYAKSQQPDALISVGALPQDQPSLIAGLVPNLSEATIQQFVAQVRGKKSLLLVVTAPGLQKYINSIATATPIAMATTPAATAPTTTLSGTGTTTPGTTAPAITTASPRPTTQPVTAARTPPPTR